MIELNKIYNEDCLEGLKKIEDNSVDSIVTDPPYGLSFMGKKWDYDVPKIEIWKECLRILKPGGHALVACGTRTQHRMAVNLEDSGFEIRDIVAWIYGQGFPKSHNIGKAVDKLEGTEYPKNTVVSENGSMTGANYTRNTVDIQSDKAKKYEGWGTALKPAMELWTLCRKPLAENTIVENVLKYNTGGINIDGCRIEEREKEQFTGKKEGSINVYGDYFYKKSDTPLPSGRFPANVIFDEESGKLLDEQSGNKCGQIAGTTGKEPSTNKLNLIYGDYRGYKKPSEPKDMLSGASRFFYCPKASKTERNEGLEGFEKKVRVRQGLAGEHKDTLSSNIHPTVKPLALMKYLCRLITPKEGIIVDPFCGSGSTCIASKIEGFNFIGFEREVEYFKIAEARINSYTTLGD